jgi:hypothetical protein
MKTLKIIFVLCIITAFSTNNANSQRTTGTQEWYNWFSPEQVPCLTEVVSGYVTEYQSFTNKTYHAKAQDVIYGVSGDAYDISYEYNYVADWTTSPTSQHFTFPIVLKKDGKLVAVIHLAMRIIFNGNGVTVQDFFIYNVNCK